MTISLIVDCLLGRIKRRSALSAFGRLDIGDGARYLRVLHDSPGVESMRSLVEYTGSLVEHQLSRSIRRFLGFEARHLRKTAMAAGFDVQRPGHLPHSGCVVGGVPVPFRGVAPIVDDSMKPVVVIGDAGTNKTSGLVIPTLHGWKGSAIVFVSGEYMVGSTFIRTIPHREKLGNKVAYFTNQSGEHQSTTPASFNFIDAIRIDTPMASDDARFLASCLIRYSRVKENEVNTEAAVDALQTMLLEAAVRRGNLPDLANTVSTVAEECHDGAQVVSGDESCKMNARIHRALSVFLLPHVAKVTSASSFSLNDLTNGDAPLTVYADLVRESSCSEELHAPIGNEHPGPVRSDCVVHLLVEVATKRALEASNAQQKVLLVLDCVDRLGMPIALLRDRWGDIAASNIIKPYITARHTLNLLAAYPSAMSQEHHVVCTGLRDWVDVNAVDREAFGHVMDGSLFHLPGLHPCRRAQFLSRRAAYSFDSTLPVYYRAIEFRHLRNSYSEQPSLDEIRVAWSIVASGSSELSKGEPIRK